MEVTYGLLSSLVQTKSIERVLSPIASQISLLIILHESHREGAESPCEMSVCASSVMEAAEKLTVVARHRADTSPDQDFRGQMGSACEILDLASGNLYIAAQRLEADYANREARSKLIQSAKDVLQGTMKVLLVSDDAEVRRLIAAASLVTEKVDVLNKVTSMTDLLSNFKSFTDALALLTSLANKRQKDLTRGRQREKMITSLNMLKKSVPAISIALQNFIKYPTNAQAETSKSYVIRQVKDAVDDIIDALQNKMTEEEDLELDEASFFVSKIDQAMDALSEESRLQLNQDLESWAEAVVRHSMAVAHMCTDTYRDLIIKTCARLLQVQGRVVQLYPSMKSNPELPKLREDYDDACETLIDEFCELEKDVNIALLHLMVDVFKETTEPIEKLVKSALNHSEVDNFEECHREHIEHFQDHSEQLCQVAMFAAASSTDTRRVLMIRISACRLEKLDPEIVPAVISLAKQPLNKLTVRHIKLLMKEWMFELSNVLQLLDEMTDPRMFMIVSERKIREDINTCNGCILILEPMQLSKVLRSAVGRARRMTQVSERIIDSHDDPLFRNGLLTLVRQLMRAIAAVRASESHVVKNITSRTAIEALKKRFDQLLDAVSQVKAGISDVNHPDLLSPLRQNARRKNGKVVVSNEYQKGSQQKKNLNLKFSKLKSGPEVHKFGKEPHKPDKEKIHDFHKHYNGSHDKVDKEIKKQLVTKCQVVENTSADVVAYPKQITLKLKSAAVSGEKSIVNGLCGDLLSWNNHIVDAAQSVALHCLIEKRKSEIQSLSFDVDQLIPQMIEKSKLVALGDNEEMEVMTRALDEWGSKIEKLRFLVDLTVEKWMDITEKLCDVTVTKNIDAIKAEVDYLKEHQHAISDLVNMTGNMEWKSHPSWQEKILLLKEQKNDLENLTITIASTAEMVVFSDTGAEQCQMEELGREWSVLVHCMLFNIDSLTEEIFSLGQKQKVWYKVDEKDPITYLQKQNERYKAMLKAVFQGEKQNQAATSLPNEMRELFSDIKAGSHEKNAHPSQSFKMVAAVLFRPKKFGLIKALWIMKGLEALQLIHEQCLHFFQPLTSLVRIANCVRCAVTETERSTNSSELQMSVSKFSEDFTALRQKLLNRIQMSVELSKRGTARQCLDDLTALSPKAIEAIRSLAVTADCEDECNSLNLEWSTKAKHLVTTLEQMTDMKTYIPETKGLLTSDICLGTRVETKKPVLLPHIAVSASCHSVGQIPEIDIADRKQTHSSPQCSILCEQPMKNTFPVTERVHENVTTNGAIALETSSPDRQLFSEMHNHSADSQSRMADHHSQPTAHSQREAATRGSRCFEKPSKPKFNTVSDEIRSLDRPDDDAFLLPSSLKKMDIVETDCPYNPSNSVLAAAKYLEKEAERWEDENNPIVQVAKEMTQQMEIMAEHCHGEGTLMGHQQIIETAKAAAENGMKIRRFAEILARHCVDKRFADDLLFYADQIPMVSTQLNILATVQMTSPEDRNAEKMLVLNARNLMKIVMQTFQAAEAVCVKGLHPPMEGQIDEMNVYLLASQWQQKLLQYRNKEIVNAETDELGLRRIEEYAPPTLTQIFNTS